jgi:hypothetical protein
MANNSVSFWDGDEWKNRFREEKKGTKILWFSIILLSAFYFTMLISAYFGEEGVLGLILVMFIGYLAYKKYYANWVEKNSENDEILRLTDYYDEKNFKEMFWLLVNSKTVAGSEHAIKALSKFDVSEEEIYNALEELTAYNLNSTEFSKVLGALSVLDHPEIIELMQSLKSVYPSNIIWIYNLQNKKLKKQGFSDYQEYALKHKKNEEE